MLNYNDRNWSATVSVWLRLDPDKDLEPGYCDPVQIVRPPHSPTPIPVLTAHGAADAKAIS